MEWRSGTKKNLIARFVRQGMNRRQVYDALRPMVDSQTEPMVYKRNSPTGRVAKSHAAQLQDLWADIGRVIVLLGSDDSGDEPDFNSDSPDPDDSDSDTDSADTEPEPEPKPEPVKKQSKAAKLRSEIEWFVSEVHRIRQWCYSRALAGQSVDSIGMRPITDGTKAIKVGIPAKAMLYVMAMHWPESTRREAGIEDFDLATISEDMGEDSHFMLGYVLKLAEARIPIMLVGPAGSGKSYLAKQVADALGLKYGETPMTAGATPSWLLGSWVADHDEPYKSRPFVQRYSQGGVFSFEEMDSADPNMLVVVNNALAGDALFNPVTGEEIAKHDDFLPFATTNTFGFGGGRDFTGRERLDFATIDRFRMGRALIEIDEKLEKRIAMKRCES